MRRLSVIVPVYNSEETIEKCIKSIIQQTYHNLEIIIIDDGSSDQSYEICKRLAECDMRIKLIKNNHLGVTPTRKAGVNAASGEYIAFVDSDDWIEEHYFEKMMEDIDNVDVVITEDYIKEENRQYETVSIRHLEKGIYFGNEIENIVEKLITPKGIDCCLWNKILRTSLVQAAIINVSDEIFLFEDLAILLQIFMAAARIKVLNVLGYHYCVNDRSLIHSVHKDYLLSLHFLFQFLETVLEKCAYKEKLMKGFYRYIRLCILQSPYYLDFKLKDMSVQFQDVYYPYYGRLENARIILYGAGYIGLSYYYHIKNDKEAEIVAWVDKQPDKCRGGIQFDVFSPDIINKVEYDYIVLAVRKEKDAIDIKSELAKNGVPQDIILWNKTKNITPVY